MKLALIVLALALLSGCAGYDSGGYYSRALAFDARLNIVCRTGAHQFTLTPTPRACRRVGGSPL